MPNTTQDLIKMIRVSEDDLGTYLRTEVPDQDMETFFGQHAAAVRLYASVEQSPKKRGDSLIILLPGLTGSVLEDVGSEPEVLWVNPLAFLKGHLNRLDMTPDGEKDATPGVRIEAPRPIWIVYAKMLLRLQHEYDVCTFPYDWRRAPADHARRLQHFIDDRLAATGHKQVTLVGHSMGGLVLADYLIHEKTKAHAGQFVKRAITLGTPFRGVVQAIIALSKGDDPKMEIATKLNKANDPLKMLRSFPGMYSILPAPKGLYPGWDPLPELDIWQAETWESIGISVNAHLLADAKEHHRQVAAADPQVPLYCIVGTYYNTPVELTGRVLTALPRYIREGMQGGDGTVEVASAVFKDRPTYFVQEVHIELVLENAVIEAIMNWVEGGEPTSLVRDIKKVVLDDAPFRGAAPGPKVVVNTDQTARKISANETLSQADIQALFGDKAKTTG